MVKFLFILVIVGVIVFRIGFIKGNNTGRSNACDYEAVIRATQEYPEGDVVQRGRIQEGAKQEFFNDCMLMTK